MKKEKCLGTASSEFCGLFELIQFFLSFGNNLGKFDCNFL